MKFDRFEFWTIKQDVFVLPTIRIGTQAELLNKNFNIQFHFLIWHFRWRWIRGE